MWPRCSSLPQKRQERGRRTLFDAVLLGSLVVGVFLLTCDTLDTFVKVVLEALALGRSGAFYITVSVALLLVRSIG